MGCLPYAGSRPGGPERGGELRKLGGGNFRDREKVEIPPGPGLKVVAVAGGLAGRQGIAAGGPDEKVDGVLPAVENQRRGGTAAEVLEPAAGERKPGGGKVGDRR